MSAFAVGRASSHGPRTGGEDERVAHAARLLGERARQGEPLGPRTTYRVGGAAALFVEIEDEAGLDAVVGAVATSGVDVLVMGNGSNMLVADDGFHGLVVVLGEAYASVETVPGEALAIAGGACAYPVLARKASAAGLSGLEWAVGIPGTVGGAVRMNAGGHGASTGERLLSARVVDLATGADRLVRASELGLGYRRSHVGAHEIVVGATFRCAPGDPEQSAAEIAAVVRWRREHQPGGRNAGSVFTNPPGDSAGRLVEMAGMKGHRLGSAEVSPRHANFIQVDAGGSAGDVLRLLELVRAEVARRTGVVLETEMRIVGAAR